MGANMRVRLERLTQDGEAFLQKLLPFCGCFVWAPLWALGCCRDCATRGAAVPRAGVPGGPAWHEWGI